MKIFDRLIYRPLRPMFRAISKRLDIAESKHEALHESLASCSRCRGVFVRGGAETFTPMRHPVTGKQYALCLWCVPIAKAAGWKRADNVASIQGGAS